MAGPAAERRPAGGARRPGAVRPRRARSRRKSSRWTPPSSICPSGSWTKTGPLLDQIIAAGHRLAAEVDRVVVLGIGGSYMGARALFEACCHPYHNELSRPARGGRPRIYFEGNNVDNDAVPRAAGPARGRRRLGDHRHQQERRHAGNGRRLPHLPRRPAEVLRRRPGETAAADRARHRRVRPAARPGRGPGLPGGLSHSRRRGRAFLGAQPRGPAARRRSWAWTWSSCSKGRRP